MLSDAADYFATRQKSKQKPRTYRDYREMLAEKDLDVVLVGTPDHWHALAMIAAVESGADVYVQKPISVDVVEGKPCWPPRGNINAWSRWAWSAAPPRT
jgi:predicted dehydrogenase